MTYHIILRVDLEGFGVPYWRPDDDPTSRSYMDLKAQPERSAELPEVQGWPELKTAIDKINAHRGFKTLGCGSWVHETDLPDCIQFTSYIGFCYDQMNLNADAQAYYGLFHHFNVFLSERTLPEDLRMHFVVKVTQFNGGKLAVGYSADLRLTAFGSSVEEARRFPNLAFSLLTEFLEKP